MKITNVRVVTRENTDSRKRALATVTFDDEFVVKDIAVIDGNNGLFISMPSRRTPNGEYVDIAHPITSDCRQKIQEAVLAEYNNLVKE